MADCETGNIWILEYYDAIVISQDIKNTIERSGLPMNIHDMKTSSKETAFKRWQQKTPGDTYTLQE
jgi:murein L,D-transpeptidase YafK